MAKTAPKTVSVDNDLVEWVEHELEANNYRSFSDAVNKGLRLLKQESDRLKNHRR